MAVFSTGAKGKPRVNAVFCCAATLVSDVLAGDANTFTVSGFGQCRQAIKKLLDFGCAQTSRYKVFLPTTGSFILDDQGDICHQGKTLIQRSQQQCRRSTQGATHGGNDDIGIQDISHMA